MTDTNARDSQAEDEWQRRRAEAARVGREANRNAAIYTRVSQDASGVARSPKEQEAESRRDCERNGWPVVAVYTDNDRSASRHARKVRPDYARLLADIAGGTFDVLVVWEASRLTRDLEAYGTLAAACRSAGVLLSYGGKLLDLDNPDDEFTVGLDMLLAQRESGTTRKRILRATRANAEAGRPHGKVQFGFRRVYDGRTGALVRQEPDPATAGVVVELFTRLADGQSLHSIARGFNDRGIATGKNGGTWTATQVRQVAGSRSYLGHRLHRGEVATANAWPAIVDETLFYRAQMVLADPSRRQGNDTRLRHWLSGVAKCGRCGAPCRYSSVGRAQFPVYRCKAAGHVARSARVLESGVRLLVCEGLARPDALAAFTADPTVVVDLTGERDSLLARIADADEALKANAMTARAHGVLELSLLPQLAELDRGLAHARRDVPAVVTGLLAPTVEEVAARFDDDLSVTERRLVVRTLLVDCVLRPAPVPHGPRPDLGLRFRWCGVGKTMEV